jgi:hypothetical protein
MRPEFVLVKKKIQIFRINIWYSTGPGSTAGGLFKENSA